MGRIKVKASEQQKPLSEEGRKNWDKIFGKKKDKVPSLR